LALEGAYFRQAASLAEIAKLADAEFAKWQSVIQDTNSRIDEIIDRNPEMDDEAHDLCVVLDRDWQSFNGATGKLIQCAAAVYVLCGACLKARINIRAESVLERKKFAEFDKLSLVGKWLFYPKLAAVGIRSIFGADPINTSLGETSQYVGALQVAKGEYASSL
jgi:hypothetical protein